MKGKVRKEGLIRGEDGKDYVYSHVDADDIRVGDNIVFTPRALRATNIVLEAHNTGHHVFSPKPEISPSTKPNGAKSKDFGWTFIPSENIKEKESLESKIYTSKIRKYGILSFALPIIVAGVFAVFFDQILNFALMYSNDISNFIGISLTTYQIKLTLTSLALLIFFISHTKPLIKTFVYTDLICKGTHGAKSAKNYAFFLFLNIAAIIFVDDKIIGLYHNDMKFHALCIITGFICFFYDYKMFSYLANVSGVKIFNIALIVQFFIGFLFIVAIEFINFVDIISPITKYLFVAAISAPLFIISYSMIKMIKRA